MTQRSDGCFRHFFDAAVCDGNMMRITAEIFNCITETMEGFFYSI